MTTLGVRPMRIDRLLTLLLSLVVGTGVSADPPRSERVVDPAYSRWAKHPVGTTVRMREVTTFPGTADREQLVTYKLQAVTPEEATVEVTAPLVAPDGTVYNQPPQEFKYPKFVQVETDKKGSVGKPAGTYEDTEDTLTVLGKSYKCRRYKSKGRVEAGETETVSWFADDFPGGLVKSEHRVPASKRSVTTEVIGMTPGK